MYHPSLSPPLLEKNKFVSADDHCILNCSIELPQLQTDGSFNTFYKKICEKCTFYCRTTLLEALATKDSGNPRTSFSYRVKGTPIVSDNTVSVSLKVTLSEITRGTRLYCYSEEHIWKIYGKSAYLRSVR